MAENGCVTNKAGEPGMVKDWPQNLINAGKYRTAEFPAQKLNVKLRAILSKSLCRWLPLCYAPTLRQFVNL